MRPTARHQLERVPEPHVVEAVEVLIVGVGEQPGLRLHELILQDSVADRGQG